MVVKTVAMMVVHWGDWKAVQSVTNSVDYSVADLVARLVAKRVEKMVDKSADLWGHRMVEMSVAVTDATLAD